MANFTHTPPPHQKKLPAQRSVRYMLSMRFRGSFVNDVLHQKRIFLNILGIKSIYIFLNILSFWNGAVSLRNKRSLMKRSKFGPRKGVFLPCFPLFVSPHISHGLNAKTPSRGPNFVRLRERLLRRLRNRLFTVRSISQISPLKKTAKKFTRIPKVNSEVHFKFVLRKYVTQKVSPIGWLQIIFFIYSWQPKH